MTTSTLSSTNQLPDGPPGKASTGGLVGWSLHHRTIAIGGWVLLVLLCVLGGNLTGTVKATSVQLTPGEAGRAAAMVTAAGLDGHDVESVLITAGSGGWLPDASLRPDSAVVADLTATLHAVSGVSEVGEAVVSTDRSAVLLPVTLADDVKDPSALLAGVSTAAIRHPELHLGVSGSLTIGADVDNQLAGDFSAALIRSLPITIVILLLAFGALLAAGVPLLLGVSSVLSAVGLYAAASHVLPDGGTGAEMILLIGMAVGVDYSLFYLKRAREERRSGRSGREALTTAGATAGRAVVTSGCAVMVAMAGLFLLDDVNFASMALGAIIVVALAVLGSLTVLPAVLGLLGDKVDRPRIPLLSRLTMSDRPARIWPMLLRPALKFPALTLFLGVVGMLVLAWPATSLRLKNSTAADVPQSLPSVAAQQMITTAFPGERSGLNVVLRGTPAKTEQIGRQVRAAIGNSATFGPHPVIRSAGGTVVISIAVPFDDDSQQAGAALETMRSTVLPGASAGVVGVESAVGGSIAANVDYLDELSTGAPWVISFVVVMTFFLMTWVFRSVVVGLVTILANLLSAGAAFGVLALVFQSNWGAAFLGFHQSGGVIAWIPVFLFVILFGLSMDYHVLVISRIREAAERGLPIRDAIRDGVSGSASVITSAAAVMIAVFAIFAGLHMVEFKELGVGLVVAVFLDAIVVRILILPALMSLLGNVNWWAPSLLRRRTFRAGPSLRPDCRGIVRSGQNEAMTRGFNGRPRKPQNDRLPPGQYDTGQEFPVLTAEVTPRLDPERMSITVDGLVDNPQKWTWQELHALPGSTFAGDIHCVTTWSKFDTSFAGISADLLLAAAVPSQAATHVMIKSTTGYTTNLPLADITDGKAWVVWDHEGHPLPVEHGGPMRFLVPHLYFWKSAKWVSELTLMDHDEQGFWERNGYHDHGDPWKEERYQGD